MVQASRVPGNKSRSGTRPCGPVSFGRASIVPTTSHSAQKVQQQVQQRAGVQPTAAGGGTIFTEPILVVNQKAKLIEITNQYSVFNKDGVLIASVSEVGQSKLKKLLRIVSAVDQFMTHTLEVRDVSAQLVMTITRPRKIVKSRVIVSDASGAELGRIVQQNAIGKIRFGLQAGGQEIGTLKAENWRAWNFAIADVNGTEVARITKTFEGIAKAMFTTADNYVVQIHGTIAQPLLSLVVAAALSVDTALKQDSN